MHNQWYQNVACCRLFRIQPTNHGQPADIPTMGSIDKYMRILHCVHYHQVRGLNRPSLFMLSAGKVIMVDFSLA